ncbi:hypothetical protein YC2023_075163 [Brassica napus]
MTMCSPKNDSFFFKHIGEVSNIFAIPFFPCANYKNTDKLEQNDSKITDPPDKDPDPDILKLPGYPICPRPTKHASIGTADDKAVEVCCINNVGDHPVMPRGKSCILEATPVPFHKNDAILMSVEEDMTIMAMVEEMTTVVSGTTDSAQLQICFTLYLEAGRKHDPEVRESLLGEKGRRPALSRRIRFLD